MTLKDLKKLVSVASEQKGGWESYRAREKALAELMHYMPRLLKVAEAADYVLAVGLSHDEAGDKLKEALTALERK